MPILAIQCTSGSNVAARIEKLKAAGFIDLWRSVGASLEVWGWSKQGPRGSENLDVEERDAMSRTRMPHRRDSVTQKIQGRQSPHGVPVDGCRQPAPELFVRVRGTDVTAEIDGPLRCARAVGSVSACSMAARWRRSASYSKAYKSNRRDRDGPPDDALLSKSPPIDWAASPQLDPRPVYPYTLRSYSLCPPRRPQTQPIAYVRLFGTLPDLWNALDGRTRPSAPPSVGPSAPGRSGRAPAGRDATVRMHLRAVQHSLAEIERVIARPWTG